MSSSRYDEHSGHASDSGGGDRHGDNDTDYLMPESDEIISRVMELIDTSPSMPMSSTVRVNKDEILEMLGDALDRLPEEVRQAKWLLKDREAFLAEREREAQAIIERAKTNAARLVEKREIVKNAQARADSIIEEAERISRRRRREADDYCDQQLARYENALVKLHKQVGKMRDRLAAPTVEESELGEAALAAAAERAGSGPRTGQTRAVRKGQGQSRQGQARQGQPRQGQARQGQPRPGQGRQSQPRPGQGRQSQAQKGQQRRPSPQRQPEGGGGAPEPDDGSGHRPAVFDQDE